MKKKGIGKIFRYIGKDRWILAVVVILSMISAAFTVLAPKVVGEATTALADGVLGKAAGADAVIKTVVRSVSIAGILYLVSFIAQSAEEYVMTGIIQKSLCAVRNDISGKMNRLPVRYFETHGNGEILSLIFNDVEIMGNGMNLIVTQLGNALIMLVGIIAVMFSISVPMALIVIATIPLSTVFIGITMKASKKHFVSQQQLLGEINGYIEENISGLEVIKSFTAEKKSESTFDSLNEKLTEASRKASFISSLSTPVSVAISVLGYAVVVIAGSLLALKGKIRIGDIQAFINYVNLINTPIRQIGTIGSSYQQMIVSAERVFAFLEEEEEPQTDGSAAPDELNDGIDFEHVGFGYDPGIMVINDFSLHVDKGQKIAIVGPTGSGKTTLIKLLMRFYDVGKGTVKYHGNDIRFLDRHAYRGRFAMVLQEIWLYGASIRENIRFGKPEAADEEVFRAAEMAHADEFISLLPGGYDYVLNDDATNISAGQKQLLTIARAFLVNSPLLILDEATSCVDTRTEHYIQEAMDSLMKGRTSFVIAHRLNTIRNADVILVLKDGDIIEQGSHEELMAKQGFYFELYNSQFE